MIPQIEIKKRPSGKIQAHINGELTVKYAKQMLSCLQTISTHTDVTLVVDNPAGLDLSFVQLVFALRKTLYMGGKNFTIRTHVSDTEKAVLQKTGFGAFLNITKTHEA